MKKIMDNVRIGMVPKNTISTQLNQEHTPFNSEQSKNSQPIKEQLNTQNNNGMIKHDEQHITRLISPNNIRMNVLNEINSNKQELHGNNINSNQSLLTVRSRQETISELHEIPSKEKISTTKKTLIIVGTILVIISIIIVAIVLGIVLSRQYSTTTTVLTSSISTSTIAPIVISAIWSFENISTDNNGIYNGTLNNGATYSTIGATAFPYIGNTQALLLNLSSQWFSVPSPIFPLNLTSFTIEAWIYPTSLTSDRGIVGQCQCRGCANQCLYFLCRSNRLHIGFTSNDLTGSTILVINTWYHVAFVYNYQTQQQILYVNGVQDGIKSNAPAYQGTNGSILIGSTEVFSNTNYFNGYIDNVEIITRAKSSNEILRDASLAAYYSFDWPNPTADNGPNGINGTLVNSVTTAGRINQGIRLTGGSGSYFRINGFHQIPVGVLPNRPFSISLWINPTSTTSSTFVQIFSTPGTTCNNLLGLYSAAGSNLQLFVQSVVNSQANMYGPFITPNVWTHISLTYNSTSGYGLYINGIYFATTGSIVYSSSNTFANLFIGFITACSTATQNVAYQGSIDEVYIHNRDLTQTEIHALANP